MASLKYDEGRKRWRVQWTVTDDTGKKAKRGAVFAEHIDAILECADRHRAELGEAPVLKDSMSLDDAVQAWTADLKCSDLSPTYIVSIVGSFRRLRDACAKVGTPLLTLTDLTTPTNVTPVIRGSKGTVKRSLRRALASMIRFLRENNLIDSNPYRVDGRSSIRMNDDDDAVAHPSRHLTVNELDAIFSAAGDWELLHRLWAFTGCRTTEAGRLLWKHVDLANGLLRLPKEITKAKRADVIPLTADLRKRLTTARFGTADTDHVFPFVADDGGATGRVAQRIHRAWLRTLKAAGVEYVIDGDNRKANIKSLRYTFNDMLQTANGTTPITIALMRHRLGGSMALSVRAGGQDGSGYASEESLVGQMRTAIDRMERHYEETLQASQQPAQTA